MVYNRWSLVVRWADSGEIKKVSVCHFFILSCENNSMCFMKHGIHQLFTASTYNTAQHQYNSHLCIGILTDRPQILTLLSCQVFLFGFTQVRFTFIDDVISLYEVG